MRLIVGLGNPTRDYEGTRHNVGYMVLEELARRHASGRPKTKFHARLLDATIAQHKVLLASPLTYMNRSGTSVRQIVDFYKMEPADLLVVCDDLNLPLAKLRFRARGSSGGQKGLADVIDWLGTEEFARLRIGIGAPPLEHDASDHVLGRFAPAEKADVEIAVARGADAVACWVAEGIDECMNQYN